MLPETPTGEPKSSQTRSRRRRCDIRVRRGLAAGSAALLALLVVLATTVGLGALAWITGLACGVALVWAVARAAPVTLGPADLITLLRAVLACALAALVTDSFLDPPAIGVLVSLAVLALLTDAVDGQVARRTGTVSRFGSRFDGEVDAVLILVLSVYVAADGHVWVLTIGLARYAFAAAGWVLPWMRAQLPPRYWRKVVTAVQGIVLTVAAAAVTPPWLTTAALMVALALLGESFARDVLWLWRRRPPGRGRLAGGAVAGLHPSRP
jgi:phosphatidylglycerophosphate synthase